MASIRKRKNSFQVQIRAGGSHRSKTFKTIEEARRWSYQHEVLSEELPQPQISRYRPRNFYRENNMINRGYIHLTIFTSNP